MKKGVSFTADENLINEFKEVCLKQNTNMKESLVNHMEYMVKEFKLKEELGVNKLGKEARDAGIKFLHALDKKYYRNVNDFIMTLTSNCHNDNQKYEYVNQKLMEMSTTLGVPLPVELAVEPEEFNRRYKMTYGHYLINFLVGVQLNLFD